MFVFTFSSVPGYNHANNIAKIVLVQWYPRDPETSQEAPLLSEENLNAKFKEVDRAEGFASMYNEASGLFWWNAENLGTLPWSTSRGTVYLLL